MRKIGMLAAALLVTMPGLANRTVSKTSRIDSPIFKIASPEQLTLSRSDRMDRKEDGYKGAFQVVGLYSHSLEPDDLAAYFLPVDKSTLVTGEIGSSAYVSNLQNNQALDVCANYFNIFTDSFGVAVSGTATSADFNNMIFQSNLTFKPKHTIAGVGLQWQQEFRKYYFKIDAPIVQVTHDLGMTENIINEGAGANQTGSVANMKAAFNQAGLNYGKIDGKRSKWGVADMEIVFGRNWMDTDVCQVSSYLGILAPTGGKPNPEYLDNALVGNGGHWGFMMGSGSRYVWKETDNYTVSICWDVDSRYFLRNTQTRMLDLKNRPWSRYMWLVQKNSGFTVNSNLTTSLYTSQPEFDFAVNVLTQPVHVKSHGAFTANTAFNFRRDCGLEVEIGTNFYARQAEKVNLLTPWINYNKWMLPAVGTDLDAAAWSASANFISINNAQLYGNDFDSNGDAIGVPLTQDDIDLNSACQSAIVENTFYGSIGKNWDHWRYPSFAGIGGSYTYSGDNVGNKRFMLWAKLGTSF